MSMKNTLGYIAKLNLKFLYSSLCPERILSWGDIVRGDYVLLPVDLCRNYQDPQ
jgi:hypothetical protein